MGSQMRTGFRSLHVYRSIHLATFGALAAAGLLLRGQAYAQQTPVPSGNLAVEQLDLLEGAATDNSNGAQVIVKTQGLSGYMNIQSSAGWVAQNVPIIPGMPYVSVNI